MSRLSFRKFAALLGVFLAVWLGLKYLLPLVLPFLLGAAIALAAEPVVGLFGRRLPRGAAAAIGVTLTILLFSALVLLAVSALVRELGVLARRLPDVEQTARHGLTLLQDFLLSLAGRAPDGVEPLLTRTVLNMFSGGTALLEQLTGRLPSLLSGLLSFLPDSFLGIGTGLISGFMISTRLPRLKNWLRSRIPERWKEKYLPTLRAVRDSLGGWLKAQLKLSGLTLCIVTAGLLLLQVSYAPLVGAAIALVDAVPILGTGTILLPWALVCLLQGNTLRAIGLLAVYVTAALARSVLEPRLLGKHLGMDPLLTLIALYAGYRIWGIGGMLLAPMLTVTALQLTNPPGNTKLP